MHTLRYLCSIHILLFSLMRPSFMNQIDPVPVASIQFIQTMVRENGLSKKQCATACVSETRFNCKYFRYISGMGTCYLAIEEHLKMDDKMSKENKISKDYKTTMDDQDLSQIDMFQERLSAMELLVKFLNKKISKLEEMQEKFANLKIQVLRESRKKHSLMSEVRKASVNQEEEMDVLNERLQHLESKDKSNLAVVETFREMVGDIEQQNSRIRTSLKGLSMKIRDLMSAWTMISSEMKSMNINIGGITRKIINSNNRNKQLDTKIENVRREGIKRGIKLSKKFLDIEKVEKELLNSESVGGRLKRIESKINTLASNTALNSASLEDLESLKSLSSNSVKKPELRKDISELQNSVHDLEDKQQNLEDILMMGRLFKNIHSNKQESSLLNTNFNLETPNQKHQFDKHSNNGLFDEPENTDEKPNHFMTSVSHTGVHHIDEGGHSIKSKLNVVHTPIQNKEIDEEDSTSMFKYTSKCPTGWYKSASLCLIFLPDLVKWDDAKSRCAIRGGRVALATNMDQWKSLRIFLAIHTNLSSSVWLASRKKRSEPSGDSDGDHLKRAAVSYHPQSISMKVHFSHTIKEADCLIMEPINKFSLTKVFCDSSHKHATVCEQPVSKNYNSYESLLSRSKHASNNEPNEDPNLGSIHTDSSSHLSMIKNSDSSGIKEVRNGGHLIQKRDPSRPVNTCPSFGQQINGFCFKHISSQQPITKAMNTCKGMGGYLVTVESIQSQIALEKLLHNLGIFHTIWLSPSVSLDNIHWTWESNHRQVTYTNYLDGRPDPENRHRCNQMRKEWSFKWLDKYCSDSTSNQVRHSFVCQF